jgi:hypothetical protein
MSQPFSASDTLDDDNEEVQLLSDDEMRRIHEGGIWFPEPEPIEWLYDGSEEEDAGVRGTVPLKLSDFTKFAFRLPSGTPGSLRRSPSRVGVTCFGSTTLRPRRSSSSAPARRRRARPLGTSRSGGAA